MKIVWRSRALINLAAIQDYIERENPRAARQMEQRIKKVVSMLSRTPEMGRPGRIAGTREMSVPGTPYIVAYAVSDEVRILAIVHSAQKWPRLN